MKTERILLNLTLEERARVRGLQPKKFSDACESELMRQALITLLSFKAEGCKILLKNPCTEIAAIWNMKLISRSRGSPRQHLEMRISGDLRKALDAFREKKKTTFAEMARRAIVLQMHIASGGEVMVSTH